MRCSIECAAVAAQSVPPDTALLLATIVFLRLVVSLTPSPPAKPHVFSVIVLLVMVSVPWALRMPPLLAAHELPLIVVLLTVMVPPALLRMPPASALSHSLPTQPSPETLPTNVLASMDAVASLSSAPTMCGYQ